MFIHNFWTSTFPIFDDFQFIYYMLDVLTIMVIVRTLLTLPEWLILPRTSIKGVQKW